MAYGALHRICVVQIELMFSDFRQAVRRKLQAEDVDLLILVGNRNSLESFQNLPSDFYIKKASLGSCEDSVMFRGLKMSHKALFQNSDAISSTSFGRGSSDHPGYRILSREGRHKPDLM